jgi:hypothetical protein
MNDEPLDLDFAVDYDALNREGLLALARRIEESTTVEHFIYRELEIDQIWRLLDQGEVISGYDIRSRDALIHQIEQIHDLIGVEHDGRAAAAKLRSAVVSELIQGSNHVVS